MDEFDARAGWLPSILGWERSITVNTAYHKAIVSGKKRDAVQEVNIGLRGCVRVLEVGAKSRRDAIPETLEPRRVSGGHLWGEVESATRFARSTLGFVG